MKRKLNLLLCITLFLPLSLVAQQVQVRGKVIEAETGQPLPGVSILVDKSTRGVTTDIDGTFEIRVLPSDKLVFSFLGMDSQTIEVDKKTFIEVALAPAASELDEVTIVAFGKQKKESVVSAITTVKPADLKVPSSNLTTSLAGRAPGLISFQRTGEPGSDNASFFVRGITTFGSNTNPLILIDNIELSATDLAQLQPDDIESFSIMKDAAATALYGARGANGVILITTKKGQPGRIKTTIRVENSVSSPTKNLELADPVTYMKLHNQAITSRDPLGQQLYSDDKIYNTVPGSGSLIYPATDWYSELLKNNTRNQRVNLSISGGGDLVTYYLTGSYTHDTGILKVDSRNNFNNGISNDVFTVRSNITLKPTKTTQISSRFNGSFTDYTGPVYTGSQMYSLIMRSNPVLFPAYYPPDEAHQYTDHILFGNQQSGNTYYLNPYAEMVKGYRESGRSNLSAQLEVTQDLNFLTEGLSARALFNVLRISSHSISRNYNPFWYGLGSYNRLDNTYSIVNLNPESGTDYLSYTSTIDVPTANLYFEGALNYSRVFDKNSISGMLVYQLRNDASLGAGSVQASLPYRNVGLSGRFTYGYDDRYFLELNFGYNGSERFYKDNRFGFFPSSGIAWNIAKEPWFAESNNFFNSLRLRATYGLVGNDKISDDRFLYLSEINMDNQDLRQYFGFERGYNNVGISVSRYSDPNITWEIARKTNFALEFELKNGLSFTGEYYFEDRSNILQTRSNIPSTMGLWQIPQANVGKAKAYGVDLSLTYDKSFNSSTWLQLMGNFTFARSKYLVYDELYYENEWWLSRVGYPINQMWGYIAERLFIDDNEVANSPTQFGTYIAGDIKYRDVNNDGQITALDRVPIGYPTIPEIIYGFGASLGYKSFDASVFFQGLGNESFWIDYNETSPFFRRDTSNGMHGINQLTKFIAESHWNEDNRDIYAIWPRLSTSSINNNNQTSTWFMRDGSFLRLKSAEVGYTLPSTLTKTIGIQNLRIYLSGINLLTWSKFKLWDVEQGSSAFNYPIQRVYNMGINITF
ncbi:TonB-dependent receptor [uncultured Proteiniphilum sp.]|uniref:SusC/RagA family TonB-linked outer membrane protein n=1 Tax=uncultured Proteiniphilum sp. TaxID=497637 RepID=UPI00263522ED|nr:TonB-dependent receptor [uncultured Proteiniphilum sp.]